MACPAGYTLPEGPRNAPFAAATETFELGQHIDLWDYDVIWSENHIPASRLEPLRKIGDVLADNALEALHIKPGVDALAELRAYVSRPESDQESPAPRLLMDQLMTVPDWLDWDQVRRGQDVYWRYSMFISHALLHFSLAGGFVIPKITKVLNSTGYLSGKSTKKRVLETHQFVLDVVHSLEYLFPGTGTAWESTVQVRFMHAGVRARLTKISRTHSKYYDVNEYGVPINQEDLLATLFAFSSVMWRVMESRMNIHMTMKDREDYLHLWRYIGYIMGVDDVLGAVLTPDRADACIDSITLHLTNPDAESGKMCATLLSHVSPKPVFVPSKVLFAMGFPDLFKLNMAMAESLQGSALWNANGLPKMSKRYHFMRMMFMNFLHADFWIISKFPWLHQARKTVLLKSQYMMVARQIGRKRTKFELTEVPKAGNRGFDGQTDGWLQQSYSQRVWPKLLTAASAAVGAALLLALRG